MSADAFDSVSEFPILPRALPPKLSESDENELETALADAFVTYFRSGLPRFKPKNVDWNALGSLVRELFPDDYLRMSAAGWF